MNKIILIGLLVLSMTGCTQLGALGIEPDENAVGCIVGGSNAVTGAINGNLRGVTAEVGKTDTTNWTADDWKSLLQICTDSSGV